MHIKHKFLAYISHTKMSVCRTLKRYSKLKLTMQNFQFYFWFQYNQAILLAKENLLVYLVGADQVIKKGRDTQPGIKREF